MKNKNIFTQNLISLIFIAFIGVISLLYFILPKAEYSSLEKRYLADAPIPSSESLLSGGFTADAETFLADHTPFRSFFAGLNAYYNLVIGNNGANGVYLADNGMLIEEPCSRENRLEENMMRIRNFADAVAIPVNVAIAPSKGYIYADRLPANSPDYLDGEYLSTVSETLKGSANYIDLKTPFEKVKDDFKLYYNTDHHWTSRGAYTAYKEICKSLSLTAADESSYSIESHSSFLGTSYSTSAYYLTESEPLEIWRSKLTNGEADIEITEGSDIEKYDNMFFTDNLQGDDEYTVFLDGNHSLVTIHNDKAEKGTLLVIKDSFAHCLVPFLSDNYSDIIMVDLRYYKKPLEQLIESYSVDCALFIYSLENLAESTDIILQ